MGKDKGWILFIILILTRETKHILILLKAYFKENIKNMSNNKKIK